MPPSFWAKALVAATYLVNRRPSKAIQCLTPYEHLHRRCPSLHHLHVFGFVCYPNLLSTACRKLSPRSTTCVFLGYPSSHKGYRGYDASSQRVILCREMQGLRQPAEASLIALPWHTALVQRQTPGGEEAAPPAPTVAPLAPFLWGDRNSPLSMGLDTARWPPGFKMLDITPFEGCMDPSEFLQVYEMDTEAFRGDDTTKAKSITLALRGWR